MWKICGKAQFPQSFGRIAFQQNFHTRKLGEITVLYTLLFITITWQRKRKCSLDSISKLQAKSGLSESLKLFFNFFFHKSLPNWHSDVVTTLWHGRKWELYRRQFPTLWQRRSPTLSRRCLNVATTSPQH